MNAAPTARLTATETSFRIEAYEKIDYTLEYVAGIFDTSSTELADSFRGQGRVLMVIDENVQRLHGQAAEAYFEAHEIALTVVPVRIAETATSLRTLESIVDAFAEFGLNRKERVLVVGGGLTTDVAGFTCSTSTCTWTRSRSRRMARGTSWDPMNSNVSTRMVAMPRSRCVVTIRSA